MRQHWLAALAIGLSAAASLAAMPAPVAAQDVKKPNILVSHATSLVRQRRWRSRRRALAGLEGSVPGESGSGLRRVA
jgi:hypothetical protein